MTRATVQGKAKGGCLPPSALKTIHRMVSQARLIPEDTSEKKQAAAPFLFF
jgi:hypothetical protein